MDLFGAYLGHPPRIPGGVFTVPNLVTIDAAILIIWKFQHLAHFAENAQFMPPNMCVVLASWPPKWAAISVNL